MARELQTTFCMTGYVRNMDGLGGVVRRQLMQLTTSAMRALSQLARRLGHPAFATVPISAVMLSPLQTVTPDQSLEDVAQFFVGGRCTQLPVVDQGMPVAVVTRDDVAIGLEQKGPHAAVAEAPRHDVVTVAPSDALADVLERLRENPETIAVVIDGTGSPVGVLTFERLVEYTRGDQQVA